jgi:hypothetical protein
MKRPSYLLLLLVICLLFIPLADLEAQCAMCKEAAEASMKDNPRSMARSLNKGILYLMAVPYLAIAFIFRKQIFLAWKKVSSRFQKKTTEG